MERWLIRNAEVVLPEGVVKANVLVEHGRIASVDAPDRVTGADVVDAAGLVLLPGVIDDQVHFRDPGLTHKEDLYTATRACAKGGVTSFLEMPNTKPETISQARLEEKLALGRHKSIVNYGFYMGATPNNLADLKVAHRTPGIKIFIGSSTGDLLVDDQEALEAIFAETKLPICAHCEDETTVRANRLRLETEAAAAGRTLTLADHSRIRDVAAAVICTRRAFDLADRHNHNFHLLHVSTAAELELLRGRTERITAEVCPHHLWFSVEDYETLGSRVQMNPSIKSKEDNAALWQALIEGTIQVVATDHAPHTLEEKAQPYPQSPSGLPAVENVLALMLSQVVAGRLTLRQIADRMSDAPARVWNMVGKGRIAPGYDADLVLVDLKRIERIEDRKQETKTKWSPWHGHEVQGWPVRTWAGGRLVFADGVVLDQSRGSEIVFDLGLGGYWRTPTGTGPRSGA
jgi:dihydroorotase